LKPKPPGNHRFMSSLAGIGGIVTKNKGVYNNWGSFMSPCKIMM